MWPSRWWWANGHLGALMGSCVKLGPPRRDSWVSRYENRRPCSSGSLLKSMPGGILAGQKATCSVSAKKLSGQRSSTKRPILRSGISSSGRSEEHTSELQSPCNLVCRLLLEKKKPPHHRVLLDEGIT